MADAIPVLKQQGAMLVDPADVPSLAAKDPKDNFAVGDFCSGTDQGKGTDESCSVNFWRTRSSRRRSGACRHGRLPECVFVR